MCGDGFFFFFLITNRVHITRLTVGFVIEFHIYFSYAYKILFRMSSKKASMVLRPFLMFPRSLKLDLLVYKLNRKEHKVDFSKSFFKFDSQAVSIDRFSRIVIKPAISVRSVLKHEVC